MIKNIIFDFGGVIYNIDHQKTKDAFTHLGLAYFDKLYGHTIQTHLFEDFEIGSISPSNFRASIKNYLPAKATDLQIDQAWNALLIGFKPERINLLNKIKKNYRILLLSNTNQIHYDHYMAELKSLNLHEKFIHLFEKLYFSHQIGIRKPDKKIFDLVLRDSQIKAEETVFIDDYDLNIKAAMDIGINGLLLKPGLDLMDLFSDQGRLIS